MQIVCNDDDNGNSDNEDCEGTCNTNDGDYDNEFVVVGLCSLCIHFSVTSLKHKINIAVVDIGESPELKTRFRVNRCPTII